MNTFITFEGVEGSGKSTQIQLLGAHLQSLGLPHVLTREPSGTPIGQKIGDILFHRGSSGMFPQTELLLFCAARAQHVREVVLPALAEGKWVLCDRYADATFAYQAAGRGLESAFVQELNNYSAESLQPSLTLLFDLPVETGLSRAAKRDSQLKDPAAADRFEQEKRDFHDRVRQKYLALWRENPERITVIDADRPVDAIATDVRQIVCDFIARPR